MRTTESELTELFRDWDYLYRQVGRWQGWFDPLAYREAE